MIYFTSDTHIGHKNIIKYCNRPFKDIFEMEQCLVDNWNSIISPKDEVYHLGDVFFGDTRYVDKIFNKLNGHKHLVIGNHDDKKTLSLAWASRNNLTSIKIDGQMIVLCHYSMRVWDQSHRGSYHLFGHSHGKLPPYGLSFDVGVDAWDYKPVSFDQVKAKMATLTKPSFVDNRSGEDYVI